jgi:ATP-dependent protease ClpP protease subunit
MNKKLSAYLAARSRSTGKCFEIRNATEESTDIFIYDQIGDGFFGDGLTAQDIVIQLKNLNTRRLNVRVNSPGGDVFDGFAIYEALNRHPAEVTVYIDGLAASIASVIAMAGKRIVIAETGRVMIHNVTTVAWGTAAELRKQADICDQLTQTIISVYEARTGADRATLARWMDEETWFDADQALGKKFADEKGPALRAAAQFDLSAFGYVRAPASDPESHKDQAAGASPSAAPAPAEDSSNSPRTTPRSLHLRRQALLEKTNQ